MTFPNLKRTRCQLKTILLFILKTADHSSFFACRFRLTINANNQLEIYKS